MTGSPCADICTLTTGLAHPTTAPMFRRCAIAVNVCVWQRPAKGVAAARRKTHKSRCFYSSPRHVWTFCVLPAQEWGISLDQISRSHVVARRKGLPAARLRRRRNGIGIAARSCGSFFRRFWAMRRAREAGQRDVHATSTRSRGGITALFSAIHLVASVERGSPPKDSPRSSKMGERGAPTRRTKARPPPAGGSDGPARPPRGLVQQRRGPSTTGCAEDARGHAYAAREGGLGPRGRCDAVERAV